jgi:hypothetical protein
MRVALAAPRLARLLLGEHPRSPCTDQWGQSKGGGPQHTKLPLTPGGTRRRRAERPSFFVAREDAESRRHNKENETPRHYGATGFRLAARAYVRAPSSFAAAQLRRTVALARRSLGEGGSARNLFFLFAAAALHEDTWLGGLGILAANPSVSPCLRVSACP